MSNPPCDWFCNTQANGYSVGGTPDAENHAAPESGNPARRPPVLWNYLLVLEWEGTVRTIFILLLVFSLAAGAAGAAAGEAIDREAEIEEISRSIDACIGWFKNKDFDLLFSVVAHDSSYISVHPTDNVVRGWKQFLANSEVFKNPEFKYKRHELRDLLVTMSRSGDVAWFFCRLDDMNTWQGRPANWENARWTGVLEKRDGRWQIVQQHFSFAAE